jgi:hypothetical protein
MNIADSLDLTNLFAVVLDQSKNHVCRCTEIDLSREDVPSPSHGGVYLLSFAFFSPAFLSPESQNYDAHGGRQYHALGRVLDFNSGPLVLRLFLTAERPKNDSVKSCAGLIPVGTRSSPIPQIATVMSFHL